MKHLLIVFLTSFSFLLNAQDTDWAAKNILLRNAKEADLLIRLGDVDNLNTGWAEGYNPFSGKNTDAHYFPWEVNETDPQGTDRIMVGTSYTDQIIDGYSGSFPRQESMPKPIVLKYDLTGVKINSVALQIFIDDFQAPTIGSNFQVKLDGERSSYLENIINSIDQSGPIGKLITVKIPEQDLPKITDGKLEIFIDDPTTALGDGYAIDFVRLLVNPHLTEFTGNIKGNVVDAETGESIQGAVISAAGMTETNSNGAGAFTMKNIPAGLVVLQAYKTGYQHAYEQVDLPAGETAEVTIKLTKNKENTSTIQEEINKKGKINLYGIYFDVAKSTIKPASEAVLRELLEVLKQTNETYTIIGHTDSDGDDASNQKLSEQRAQSVVNWLVANGIPSKRLIAKGMGEKNPVAENTTPEGKALNRRVEISK